jgi:shikimate kinase
MTRSNTSRRDHGERRPGPVVVMVGPPGAGKSKVGRILAARLGVEFRDTDKDVEAAAGKTVQELFVEDGEPAFRAMEADAVRAAIAQHDGVLALGGGAVLNPDSRAVLSGLHVVFLDVDLAEATRRIGLKRDRPLLMGNIRAQMKALMDARRPLYQEVAMVTVHSDGRPAEEVADDVLKALGTCA